MTSDPWSDAENDAIVADYFAMLADDLSGTHYSKTEHNRALQAVIGRGRGAIEYKHQNLSAVLKGLGETWITGYKPAFNFQWSLVDAVARYLARHGEHLPIAPRHQLAEPPALYLGTAPTLRNAPPPGEAEQMAAVAAHFDTAARDEHNRRLGIAGEERVLSYERNRLQAAGRPDLALKIRWTSQEDGDGCGYDIASFEDTGAPRLIEVKTTNGWERTPFHISRNELAVSKEYPRDWCILRVWNFSRAPKAFELRPPLERHVDLMPTSFQASFH